MKEREQMSIKEADLIPAMGLVNQRSIMFSDERADIKLTPLGEYLRNQAFVKLAEDLAISKIRLRTAP